MLMSTVDLLIEEIGPANADAICNMKCGAKQGRRDRLLRALDDAARHYKDSNRKVRQAFFHGAVDGLRSRTHTPVRELGVGIWNEAMELNFWPDSVFLRLSSTGFTRPARLMDGDGESKPGFPWHMVRAGFTS